jgi:hypothetical protein
METHPVLVLYVWNFSTIRLENNTVITTILIKITRSLYNNYIILSEHNPFAGQATLIYLKAYNTYCT